MIFFTKVYKHSNDFYITVGANNMNRTPPNENCYRTDVSYPEVTAENVDGIEFRLFGDKTKYYTNVIRDRIYIEKVFAVMSNENQAEYLNTSSVVNKDYAKRIGQVYFYNDDLPGLYAMTVVLKYHGEFYYYIDTEPGTDWLCVKDDGTVPFES